MVQLQSTYVLLVASSVVVLVSDGSEQIHAKDLVEEGFRELSSSSCLLGGRSESLDRGNKASSENDGGLHGSCC